MKQHRIALAIASLFSALPVAWAAEGDAQMPEIQATTNQTRPGSPNDIVTTGSKTDTPLRDIPASIIVVPSAVLRDQGVLDMNRAMENASGVQPVFSGGYGFANNYAVRGLPMRFLRDGYPDGTSQNGYWRTMYDVERIEVLKGPGSALYGSGQPGGTVNLISKPPKVGFGAEVGVLGGSFGTRGSYADVWGSLGKNVAGRLIADIEKTDGFRGLSRDIREISPSFTWTLADDKVLNVDFDHREIKVKPDNYGILFNSQRNIAPASRESRFYSPMNFTDQTIDRLSVAHDWRLNADLNMHTTVIYDKRDLSLLRNAGSNAGNAGGVVTGRTLRSQTDDVSYTTLQNELVWKTRAGGLKQTVLAGVEYSASDARTVRTGYALPDITNINAPVVPETSLSGLTVRPADGFNRKITSGTWSLYGQDQIELSDQFKVRFGLRRDMVRADDVGAQGTTANRVIQVRDSIDSASLGGVWQPSKTLSFYTGVSTGGFVNLTTESSAINTTPEKASQVEAGVKATLMNGKLDANLAVFDSKRKNYYITLPGASEATPGGSDRTQGIELDLTARPMRGLSLLAGFVLQDARTDSNTIATNSVLGVSRSIAGGMPAGVAKRGARVWGTWEFQQPELQGWGVGAGFNYKSASFADSLNLYEVPAYTVMDAAIFYKAKKWDANLKLNNLTDRTYYTNSTGSGALPGESRNALLTVRYRFN